MATGREARAERLNERLRGAQRTNVGDESFHIDIGDFGGTSAPPSTSPRQEQSSPAKRRRTDNGAPASSPRNASSSAVRRSPRARDPYDLPSASKDSAGPANATSPATRAVRAQQPAARDRSSIQRVSGSTPIAPQHGDADSDELEALRLPSSARSAIGNLSGRGRVEEIGESPLNAPGSGRRTSVRAGSARASSVRLQGALQSEQNTPVASSPLIRKARPSEAAASARSSRGVQQTQNEPDEGDDELLSPEPETPVRQPTRQTPSLDRARRRDDNVEEEDGDDDGDEAQTIEETEAARTIGLKRPRTVASPQLGSNDGVEAAPPKRKRGRPRKSSPAAQRQGSAKSGTASRAAKPKTKPAQKKARRPRSDGSDQGAIELTVQKFVNHRRRRGDDDDDDDADPLQLDMPFANRNEESAVDVFAQVCDEVIANTVDQFQRAMEEATDTARKKELRTKIRAVEAYREVLNSRLLQHAIHLNHWNSLRKRIRYAQREKLSLREEILRLKAEREQVALRMDAVRMKHEADTKDSTLLLSTSGTMRDIDLAVAQGREAPELTPKAQKEAELANLELAVAQVAEQVSSSSHTGGLLSQLRDFNAFLERTAETLESR